MLNARTLRDWLLKELVKDPKNAEEKKKVIAKHMIAVSTNIKATSEFGIESSNVFGFWDWVGRSN
jgi:glucose-6-phosphate isomerase